MYSPLASVWLFFSGCGVRVARSLSLAFRVIVVSARRMLAGCSCVLGDALLAFAWVLVVPFWLVAIVSVLRLVATICASYRVSVS